MVLNRTHETVSQYLGEHFKVAKYNRYMKIRLMFGDSWWFQNYSLFYNCQIKIKR